MTNFEDPFEIELLEHFDDRDYLEMTITSDNNVHKVTEELLFNLRAHFNELKGTLTKNNPYFDHIKKVPELLSTCLVSEKSQSEEFCIKETKLQNLRTAETCLKILLIYLESPQTTEVTKSIIQTSLKILYQAYTHCKDSEIFYGEFFEEFTNELAIFYKHIQEVQKVALKGLDELINADSFDRENERSEIFFLSQDVGLLCELLLSLDRNIASIFWKVFTKLISKYKDVINNLEIEIFLQPLLADIENILFQCVSSIERKEEVFESDIKVCIIELSFVKRIVQSFNGCLKDRFILVLRTSTLQLFSILIKMQLCSGITGKDFNIFKVLLKTMRHSVASFFCEENFLSSSIFCSPQDITSEFQIPLILLKLFAVDSIKSNSGQSPLQNIKILEEMFLTLKENKPDDNLKFISLKIPCSLIQDSGRESGELLSLYQLCYIILTEYFKCNNTTSEILIEKNFLDIFISSSDVVSLLISDIWIYCLRCGSVENAFNTCKTLADFCMQFQSNSKVEQFLLRALKFLPSDYKIEFFKAFERFYYLYYQQSIEFKSSQITHSFSKAELCSEKINSLLNHLNASKNEDMLIIIQKAYSILEFGTLAFDDISPHELLQFIKLSSILFKSDVCDIQLAIIQFLENLKGKILSRNEKELDTLTSFIAELLSDIMKSNNYIIRLEALKLYIKLAESTPHLEIVKKTVIKCPDLRHSIESYLKKNPLNGFLDEETRLSMSQKQLAYCELKKDTNVQFSEKSKKFLSNLLL